LTQLLARPVPVPLVPELVQREGKSAEGADPRGGRRPRGQVIGEDRRQDGHRQTVPHRHQNPRQRAAEATLRATLVGGYPAT